MDNDADRPKPQRPEKRPSVSITVREHTGGTFFGIAGLLLAVFAAWRTIAILGPVFAGFADCGEATELTLAAMRVGAILAAVAGVVSIVLCEIGVRREMKPRSLGVAGSVLGVFCLLVGGTVFVLLWVPSLTDCFPI